MKLTALRAIKQYAQIVGLVLVVWALTGPVGNLLARSRRLKDRPVITVGVYNYAAIRQSALREAESDAAAVFAVAGVRIAWLECQLNPASSRSPSDNPVQDLSVRILRSSAITQDWQTGESDAMGESIVPSGVNGPVAGGIADIFCDRVKKVAWEWGPTTSGILGEAIAHELGHLMLGPGHSPRGIMKAVWTRQDQLLVSRCQLRFLPAQAVALQHAARSLHSGSSPIVLARR